MNFEEKIDEILEKNMTEKCFMFWKSAKKKLPKIWNRPSSSSLKYHKDENGKVHSIAKHTWEMLYMCVKIWRLFNIKSKTEDGDVLLLAITLHDSFKYDIDPENHKHTTSKHDKIIGDMIKKGRGTFLKFLSEEKVEVLEEAVRYHSGRWSTDAGEDFNFKDYNPETFFVHMIDMLSTNNLIKIIEEK